MSSSAESSHRRRSGPRWQWRTNALIERILDRSRVLTNCDDQNLKQLSLDLGWQARTDTPLSRLLPEAFALVHEASRRVLGFQHYPVQVYGAIALFHGCIAEMQTGEGKTLTALMPVFLRALCGQGSHIVTVNDYLAKRDAETMGPIFEMLGLSVGCIQSSFPPVERRRQYAKDVTYGTAKEIGFDFLRDRLSLSTVTEQSHRSVYSERASENWNLVQRGLFFALVDEADSILIDEARTPLIIGLQKQSNPADVSLYRWSRRAIDRLTINVDFFYAPQKKLVQLTEAGSRKIVLMLKPAFIDSIDAEQVHKKVEQALAAHYGFIRDRDYVVTDNQVMIVDESTGRIADGRKWQDGLHQTIEAKENLPITPATGTSARITVQKLFRHYAHLAGMTGTAVSARREIKKTFHLSVRAVPTDRPCIRKKHHTRIFSTAEAKRHAIAEETKCLIDTNRAVLIGTPSVEASELLGTVLRTEGIRHVILNARFHDQEADIVSQAGQPRRVTIATNMAGRGTDIKLSPEVASAGGLHVIASEMHSSERIDRQLIGRAARQGDPGSYRFLLSLHDELLKCLDQTRLERLFSLAALEEKEELTGKWLDVFRKTQKMLERDHRKQRKLLMDQDDRKTKAYRQMGLDPYSELLE